MAACAALLLLAAGHRQGQRRPATGCASWLAAGRRSASGLLVVDAESRQVLCASAPGGAQRPLASNMKLFTTATALSQLGPETRIATKLFARRPRSTPTASSTAASTCRAAATRRWARRPSTTATSAASAPTSSPSSARSAPPGSRRSPAGSTPTTTIFDRRRGVADSGYATSPYIGPLSGLAFNSGFSGSTSASGFSSDPAKLAAAKLARSLRAAGVAVPAQVALASDARRAPRRIARGPLADRRPARQRHRRLLQQLLRRDADQAARRPVRRRRHDRRRGARWSRPSPAARLRRPRRRRLRA